MKRLAGIFLLALAGAVRAQIPTPTPSVETFATTSNGIALRWTAYSPVGLGSGKVPAVITLHPGGYKTGNMQTKQALDCAVAGMLGLAAEYRLAPPHGSMNSPNHPTPAQNTVSPVDDGQYPEQTDDVRAAIRAARIDSRCNGLVYVMGGSAGASHTAYWCANGTPGDDMPDLAVISSCGVSNLDDANLMDLSFTQGQTDPNQAVLNYIPGVDPSALNPQSPNYRVWTPYHTALQAASPVTYVHNTGMPPMMVVISAMDSNGIAASTGLNIQTFDDNNQPNHGGAPENGANGWIPTLISHTYVRDDAQTVPVAHTFKVVIVPVTAHKHAFEMWDTSGTVQDGFKDKTIAWLLAGPPAGASAPASVTTSATNMTTNSATLNGTVNPNGIATTYHFDWGLTSSYGSVTSTVSAGSGSVPVAESASITGLIPNTTYHFRISATNSGGTVRGQDVQFTSASPNWYGVYCFGAEQVPPYNIDVTGWAVAVTWHNTSNAFNSYTWTAFDNPLNIAQAANKQIAVHGSATSEFPDYINTNTAITKWRWHRNDGDVDIVLPWDVQNDIISWTAALCDHIDGKASFYTIGGLGYKTETYMPLPSESGATGTGFPCERLTNGVPDGTYLNAYYTDTDYSTRYTNFAHLLIDTVGAHLSKTGFVIAGGVVWTNGTPVMQEILNYGLKYPKFGGQQWGLNAKSSNNFFVNGFIQTNDAGRPGGFQLTGCTDQTSCGGNPCGSPPLAGCTPLTNGLQLSLANGYALGADFVEIYHQDLDTTAHPEYVSLVHTYDQMFKAKAATSPPPTPTPSPPPRAPIIQWAQ